MKAHMTGGDLALTDSRIRLRNGRILAYAEYGTPGGRPVMFFHGSPGARLLHPKAIMAGAAGTRIISVERPGYGYSDFSAEAEMGMLGWADDVSELADLLGIERFAVVGPSGGGPYAAACAYRLSDRITAAGLVSSPAPLPSDRHPAGQNAGATRGEQISDTAQAAAREMSFVDYIPWVTGRLGSAPPDFEQMLASMKESMPECEKPVLELPEVSESFRLTGLDAFRQGWKGYARDVWLRLRPWGFRLEDIAAPVYLWHGELDDVVPVDNARYLAATIPNCQATYYADMGHLVPPECWEGIYASLVG